MIGRHFLAPLAYLSCVATAFAGAPTPEKEEPPEINTTLMSLTFKLVGDGAYGTAFVLGKPLPPPKDPMKVSYVMVTAAHVLDRIKGETAKLDLRKNDGQRFVKLQWEIRIRENGKALWSRHPSEDVAAMFVTLPEEAGVRPLPTSVLASDETLKNLDIHPGDMLSCLGFPYGAAANDAGFPILRNGFIASYPLLPVLKVKTFLFDMHVFEGNSGGPVYLAQVGARGMRDGGVALGGRFFFVAGLVTELTHGIEETKSSSTEISLKLHNLGLAKVVHAAIIRETIEMLPAEPK